MNADTFAEAVALGVSSGEWGGLEAWIFDESRFCYNYEDCHDDDPFDDAVFDLIVGLLGQDDYLGSPGSFNVLRIVEYDWGRFSENQKSVLLAALEAAYPVFNDPMSWFLSAEILGEYFCDRNSLEALLRLKRIEGEGARSQVAFGLGLLARKASDEGVAAQAAEHLGRMTDDPSAVVKGEVHLAKRKRSKP